MLEKDGSEAVGGVVMMRYGENPLAVTQAIKAKIAQLQPGLPPGVRIVPFYDRTRLIEGAIHTLVETLATEMIIASVAILLILMHFRSARGDLPYLAAGRARVVHPHAAIWRRLEHHVAVGHRHLDRRAGRSGDRHGRERDAPPDRPFRQRAGPRRHPRAIVLPACRTVGRPIFFSVMIILLSFIPVFALTGHRRQDRFIRWRLRRVSRWSAWRFFRSRSCRR